MVDGPRSFVRQRIDECERPAWLQPATDDRKELEEPGPRDVAQPEAGEDGIDLPIGLGPGVAHVEVRPELVRDEALTCALERRRRPIVERELALRGEEGRPPTCPCRELDDLAPDRQLIEPAPGDIELGVPGCVVDRPALVSTATQVPVVVFRGSGLVVGQHGRVDIWRGGWRRRLGHRSRSSTGGPALGQSLAQPEPQEAVVTGLADAVRTELCPALQVVGAAA
jgi:hypothetical protein